MAKDLYIERNRGYITCSKFKLYLKSKEAYKKIFIDEIDTSEFIKESKSLVNGSIVDKYILTPNLFWQQYASLDGNLKDDLIRQCNERGIEIEKGDKVEDLRNKLVGDKIVLTDGDKEMLYGIERELKRQPLYDFEGLYDKQKELVVEYKGFKLKGTLDRYSLEKKLIRDLKTTKDLEYNPYYDMTYFENKLINNDEYQYGLQLARYWLLCYINTGEEFDAIIDGIKVTGNYAYGCFYYHKETLKKIVNHIIFPNLNRLIEDHNTNNFEDKSDREILINSPYYPILDAAVQKEYRVIEPYYG